MIQANELRIGNWVMGKDSNGWLPQTLAPTEVKSISFASINQWSGMGDSGCVAEEDMEGIFLTEEILLKCGFERHIKEMNIDGIEMKLQVNGHDRDGTWFSSCGKFNGGLVVMTLCRGNYVCDNIEYLHQLQNLYFALAGKELEVAL